MPKLDRTGPWWGSGPMTGRRRGMRGYPYKRNASLKGLSVTSVAWTGFKIVLTFGLLSFMWKNQVKALTGKK